MYVHNVMWNYSQNPTSMNSGCLPQHPLQPSNLAPASASFSLDCLSPPGPKIHQVGLLETATKLGKAKKDAIGIFHRYLPHSRSLSHCPMTSHGGTLMSTSRDGLRPSQEKRQMHQKQSEFPSILSYYQKVTLALATSNPNA